VFTHRDNFSSIDQVIPCKLREDLVGWRTVGTSLRGEQLDEHGRLGHWRGSISGRPLDVIPDGESQCEYDDIANCTMTHLNTSS